MVTGELKNKVDGLWEIFWTGGLTNPLDVIEQMTYLMFIRDLDDSDNVHMKESIMLGLPYKSIFEENVTIGDRSSGESAQVERISRFFRLRKCMQICRKMCSRLSKIFMEIKRVPMQNIWEMRSLKCRHRSCWIRS